MTQHNGCAARELSSPLPESAVLVARRAAIRAQLPARLEGLQRSLALAVGALDGPDPEAAFGYLDLLDEHLQALLSNHP